MQVNNYFCCSSYALFVESVLYTMLTSHIKNRDMIMQVVLFVITLGIYALYWYYSTLKDLHTANGKDEGAGIWALVMLVPILGYFAYWHYASEFSEFTVGRYPTLVMFLAWIVFAPIVWLLVQMELNKAAAGGVSQPSAA